MSPEQELLTIRLAQFRRWLHGSKLGRIVSLIGTFVLVYIALGASLLVFMFASGVNPTLVLSVIAAPLWIGVLWVSYRIARIAMGKF